MNDKNITVENSKAVFNLIIENDDFGENNENDDNNHDNIVDNNNEHKYINVNDNDGIEFKGVITNEEFEQLYNQLKEEYNISNFGTEEFVKLKIEEILKKEDYSGLEKEDIINDLKEKIMDEIF